MWPAVVEEVLGHRGAGVRRHELDRRGLVGARGDDDRRLERARLGERLGERDDRRHALADRDVHRDDVGVLVVDDRVDRDRRLAGLAVADDQLALAAADRDHRVDRLQAGLQRLDDRLALDDARGLELGRPGLGRLDVALAVERVAERVDDAPEQGLADGDLEQAAGALDRVALDDLVPVAEEHGADVVGLEVQRQAGDVVRQLEHLERLGVLEAVDARDAVADRQHGADLGQLGGLVVEPLDAALEDGGDLVGLDLHGQAVPLATCLRRFSRRLRMEASRTELPTWSTRPPRMSGSTSLVSSTLRPVRSPMRSPMERTVSVGQLDRRGDLHRKHLVLLLPERLEALADAEERGHAVLLDEQAEEVQDDRVGVRRRAVVSPSIFSSVEKYGEKKKTCRSRLSAIGVGDLAELLAHVVELVGLLGDLEQRAGVDLGDLLHRPSSSRRPRPGRRSRARRAPPRRAGAGRPR